ncbi:MAG TPA: MIP/aquaporin family protein [Burkholderiales bacterium]|nr:MIP/aquaporin family protein [Burkholderiales bacterium]
MSRRVAAEGLGTALLLAIVVGSGIMGERLAEGNAAVALLANSLATGAGLFVLIAVFSPVSGAHFNPAVTLALSLDHVFPAREVVGYLAAQIVGACLGTFLAHAMFGLPLLQTGARERATAGEWLGEAVATFGLVLFIRLLSGATRQEIGATVALWISAAYWFTSSTSFANPAVTIARALTDTFAGIAPANVPAFIAAQLVGAALAVLVARRLA